MERIGLERQRPVAFQLARCRRRRCAAVVRRLPYRLCKHDEHAFQRLERHHHLGPLALLLPDRRFAPLARDGLPEFGDASGDAETDRLGNALAGLVGDEVHVRVLHRAVVVGDRHALRKAAVRRGTAHRQSLFKGKSPCDHAFSTPGEFRSRQARPLPRISHFTLLANFSPETVGDGLDEGIALRLAGERR